MRPLFTSIDAQPDNLGDLVLRQVIVAWCEEASQDVTALAARMPPGYVEHIRAGARHTTLVPSTPRWLGHVAKGVASGRAGLVYAPGAQTLRLTAGNAGHAALNAALTTVASARRAKVAKLGRSIGRGRGGMLALERVVARRCDMYRVRDLDSAAHLDMPLAIVPDLALDMAVTSSSLTSSTGTSGAGTSGTGSSGTGSSDPASSERSLVSLSFRSDRPVDVDALTAVVRGLRRLDLDPVLVTQVGRDNALHEHLSRRLQVTHVGWTDHSHTDQLARVLDTYSRSAFVVSNRLHAALFGLRVGAGPIGVAVPGHAKLASHLGAIGLSANVVTSLRDVLPLVSDGEAARFRSGRALAASRRALAATRQEFVALMS